MRVPVIGIGIAAALFILYLVIFPSARLFHVSVWVFAGAVAVAIFSEYLIKRWHLRRWTSTTGRIEYCTKVGEPAEGSQMYSFAYMYSVDGVRQGGELRFANKPGRLDQIKEALVGKQITVRYDAGDCTKSLVEETVINGWKVR